nr:lipase family protein [Corynebacterium lactis]
MSTRTGTSAPRRPAGYGRCARRKARATAAVLACLLVAGAGIGGCGGDPGENNPQPRAEAGNVITAAELPVRFDAHAQRVVFTSSKANPDIASTVSGALLSSSAAWNGPGPRPLAVIAPGTLGMADHCASSVAIRYEAPPTPPAPELLDRGWNVAIVDYEGLGTPGIPAYLNRASSAHNTLDMARAAISRLRLADDTPVAIFGYSQGGGAAAAAAELAHSYAPELRIKAVYAGAIPADLVATAQHISGSALSGLVGYAVNGLIAEYPETKQPVEAMLSPLGLDFLSLTRGECIGDTVRNWPRNDTKAFTANGRSIGENLASPGLDPVLQRRLAEQKLGSEGRSPTMPVFVTHNVRDDVLPVESARELVRTWRQAGADITYSEVDSDLGDASHGLAYALTHDEAMAWMNRQMGYSS